MTDQAIKLTWASGHSPPSATPPSLPSFAVWFERSSNATASTLSSRTMSVDLGRVPSTDRAQPVPPAVPAKHLLALKVLRAARPSLAPSDETPYLDHDPVDPAGAAYTQLAGRRPLQGGRGDGDAGVSGLLTLPSSFGTIYLGQEFFGVLSIQNESSSHSDHSVQGSLASASDPADEGHGPKQAYQTAVRVEIQTATNKVLLAEIGPTEHALEPGQGLELTVKHEIREQGAIRFYDLPMKKSALRLPRLLLVGRDSRSGGDRVLCRGSRPRRRLSPTRPPLLPQTQASSSPFSLTHADLQLALCSPVYKFVVSNPLSVKTKLFSPLTSSKASPSTIFSPSQRETTFLEVQVTNLTLEPMVLDTVRVEPADMISVQDFNVVSDPAKPDSHLPRDLAYLSPSDVSQFLFLISPSPPPSSSGAPAPPPPPGSVHPLGRLDIVWRSPHGEVGRLQTSSLVRRLPPAPVAPALAAATTERRGAGGAAASKETTAVEWKAETVVDLTVTRVESDKTLELDEPFTIDFHLRVLDSPRPFAKLHFGMQTLRQPAPTADSAAPPRPDENVPPTPTVRVGQPDSPSVPYRTHVSQRPDSPSLRGPGPVPPPSLLPSAPPPPVPVSDASRPPLLPRPVPMGNTGEQSLQPGKARPSHDVVPLGSSLTRLPPLTLVHSASSSSTSSSADTPSHHGSQDLSSCAFSLSFLPLGPDPGFRNVGGLRLVLLEVEEAAVEGGEWETRTVNAVVREWDVVSQIYVGKTGAGGL